MRLWSGRPRYANLSPDQPLSPTSPARPAQEGSSGSEAPSNVASPRPARPRASTLDRIRERKVAFETDDHESLLGADGDGEDHQSGRQTTSRRDRKSFKPSLPSLPSTKRLSFSLDSIHPKAKSKATSGLSKPEATATTDPKVSIKSAKPAHSKATKQAETVLCLIAGQDVIANGSVEKGRSQQPKAVSTKDMKELKSALTRPKDATKIIDELKKIPVPDDAHAEAERSLHSGHARTRGACLDCPEAEAIEITQSTAVAHSAEPSSDLESSELATTTMSMKERLNQLAGSGIPSAGRVLGQMATSAGAFEALAGVTGRMIDSSGAHDGIVKPPDDRMSVLVYWWGYELVLPPPSIKYLGGVHSVAGTAFTFLQALSAGGVPELTPFIRYLSMYIDMEWKAIQGQDRGRGVVLAATWILPVAVVPRPMPF